MHHAKYPIVLLGVITAAPKALPASRNSHRLSCSM